MIGAFVANSGQCKSLILTATLYDFYSSGMDVMANYTLRFPKERGSGKVLKLDVKSLLEPDIQIDNLALGITELHTIMDSRRSSSNRNIGMTNLLAQARKRTMHFLGDTQQFGKVDPRFRVAADFVGLCRKYDSQGRWVRDPLWSDAEGEARCWFYSPPDSPRPVNKEPLKIRMGPVFPLYDTYEVIRILEL